MTTSRIQNGRAWTQGLAMLAACYVTLVGAIRQVSPDRILVRAIIAGLAVLILSRLAIKAINEMTRK